MRSEVKSSPVAFSLLLVLLLAVTVVSVWIANDGEPASGRYGWAEPFVSYLCAAGIAFCAFRLARPPVMRLTEDRLEVDWRTGKTLSLRWDEIAGFYQQDSALNSGPVLYRLKDGRSDGLYGAWELNSEELLELLQGRLGEKA